VCVCVCVCVCVRERKIELNLNTHRNVWHVFEIKQSNKRISSKSR
jgi:hypothetical protein